ncbi:thymidylate kinase [Candidatus Omnitrophus magneticus]|uniref:Thymidylate kinase n=1 Tax=Candidatus Omnitrophus magneticus TaxID=1609969 RepID=A0A0F0CRR8_9BACT|nr:thymidylate kinase [Candidatus Omnitrophus magneticus]
MAQNLEKGFLITFEGPEGSGKSTQSRRLFHDLLRDGFETVITSEPGGTALGKYIRDILLYKKDLHLSPYAELFLFEADRSQHIEELIKPALADKKIVICDRFSTATLAYQGYGLDMDLQNIIKVDSMARAGVEPDLIILLDVDPDIGLHRATIEHSADNMELRAKKFHHRVREGYLKIAGENPDKIHVFESAGDISAIYNLIKKDVYRFIEKYKRAK